jgi:hypothetical protein
MSPFGTGLRPGKMLLKLRGGLCGKLLAMKSVIAAQGTDVPPIFFWARENRFCPFDLNFAVYEI